MTKSFTSLLSEQPMNIIVSLPVNSMEHVRAAIEGGADVLKVHMNVEHRASGNTFGTFDENQEFFESMNKAFKGPMGIVPGDSPEKVTEIDIQRLKKVGFQFLSIYGHTAPAWLLGDNHLEKMIAISNEYKQHELQAFQQADIQILEASIMEPSHYGTPLTIQDILHYQHLLQQVNQPIVIPTQKKVSIEDLKPLYQIGVHGLMIGAVVTGKNPDGIYETTKAFKEKILDLRK
ncbi:hypothetical protein [Evansella tamaricis]|uniref:Uncharacterized protein n=1 Tax=Evansella tamaricis TaxID=2069301 RepID=A0ABS6JK73_9BACI|nr:hypothetical protein [Evansella tamaricis]MBU9712718.1 hypothetical protein [Evansella tamaricis]